MPRIWLLDPGAVIFAGIFLFWIVFLGWQVQGKVLRPWLAPTPEEAASPAIKNTSAPKLLAGLMILFGPFFLGIIWTWTKPAMMAIDQVGNLDFRNPFFVSRLHIPASTPRTLEALIEAYPWAQDEPSFRGKLLISGADIGTTCISIPFFPTDLERNPSFFQELGFSGMKDWPKGSGGGILTPMHCFSSSGPVILFAEKTLE